MMTAHEMFNVYENGKCEENEQDEVRDDKCWGHGDGKLQENGEQSR